MLLIKESDLFSDGRVEIMNDTDDTPMKICADDSWGQPEVDVVCKQLGFEGAGNGDSLFYSK